MVRSMVPWTNRLSLPLREFEREMEALLGRFLPDDGVWSGQGDFVPRVNVSETETQFEVTAELPGLKPEEVHVELKEGRLWMSGERKQEEEEQGKTFHRVERRYGQFRRVIPLATTIDEERIEAEFADGLLKVTLPKLAEARPRPIKVKTS